MTGSREGDRALTANLLQVIAGLGLLGLLAWRVTLPYVFERSIFPTAFPWAVGAFALLGVVLIVSALLPPVTD